MVGVSSVDTRTVKKELKLCVGYGGILLRIFYSIRMLPV